MHLELPILAFASGFNEYTTEGRALYFKDVNSLHELLLQINDQKLLELGENMLEIAKRRYTWKRIAENYKNVSKII